MCEEDEDEAVEEDEAAEAEVEGADDEEEVGALPEGADVAVEDGLAVAVLPEVVGLALALAPALIGGETNMPVAMPTPAPAPPRPATPEGIPPTRHPSLIPSASSPPAPAGTANRCTVTDPSGRPALAALAKRARSSIPGT